MSVRFGRGNWSSSAEQGPMMEAPLESWQPRKRGSSRPNAVNCLEEVTKLREEFAKATTSLMQRIEKIGNPASQRHSSQQLQQRYQGQPQGQVPGRRRGNCHRCGQQGHVARVCLAKISGQLNVMRTPVMSCPVPAAMSMRLHPNAKGPAKMAKWPRRRSKS